MAQIRASALLFIGGFMLKFVKTTGIILLFFVLFAFLMTGLVKLTCLGEKSGTMVVIGGYIHYIDKYPEHYFLKGRPYEYYLEGWEPEESASEALDKFITETGWDD